MILDDCQFDQDPGVISSGHRSLLNKSALPRVLTPRILYSVLHKAGIERVRRPGEGALVLNRAHHTPSAKTDHSELTSVMLSLTQSRRSFSGTRGLDDVRESRPLER
jgi:hypothetical protein